MCPNNHDPDRLEVRPDGSRVCGACREMYQGRKNAARRVNQSKRAQRATPNGSNDSDRGTTRTPA